MIIGGGSEATKRTNVASRNRHSSISLPAGPAVRTSPGFSGTVPHKAGSR